MKNMKSLQTVLYDRTEFEGEVEDFSKWAAEGTDVNVWNLSPLKKDIERIIRSDKFDYLLLDYPFAYQHQMIKPYLDRCIFTDTPLDIALARRVLRDMKGAAADEIRNEMDIYLTASSFLFLRGQVSAKKPVSEL